MVEESETASGYISHQPLKSVGTFGNKAYKPRLAQFALEANAEKWAAGGSAVAGMAVMEIRVREYKNQENVTQGVSEEVSCILLSRSFLKSLILLGLRLLMRDRAFCVEVAKISLGAISDREVLEVVANRESESLSKKAIQVASR